MKRIFAIAGIFAREPHVIGSRLVRRDLIFYSSVGGFNDGLGAATRPRRSWSGGGETSHEMTKER